MKAFGFTRTGPTGPSLSGKPSYVHFVGCLFFWFLLLLPGAYVAGNSTAAAVESGNSVHILILNISRADAFEIAPVTNSGSTPDSSSQAETTTSAGCGLVVLGSSDGVVYLYDPRRETVAAVAVENVRLERRLPGMLGED